MKNNPFARAIIVTSLGLLLAVKAWGFALRTDDSGVYVIKWNSSPVVMQIKLSSTTNLIDGNSQRSSVAAAMQAWNAQLGTVQLSPQLSSPGAYSAGNGINEIVMDSKMDGDAFPSGVLAITLLYTRGDDTSETDIIFNTAYTWNSYRSLLRRGSEDLQRVAIHELGHVLGLLHPDEAGQYVTAIMNSREGDLDRLWTDDIAGGQKLYGAPGFAPANNDFANATAITLNQGSVQVAGSNLAGTVEPGEPTHAGSSAAHSVWWKWTAVGNGSVVATTLGSNFDTVLAVYAGGSLATLTPVASNDDEESIADNSTPQRKRTSKVTFTAVSGTTYYFAVDGWGSARTVLGGYTGSITLNLDLTVAAPAITAQPASQTALLDATVTLAVDAASGSTTPITFQWQHDGRDLAGATSRSLALASVQPADAGIYTVSVKADATIASTPAILGVALPSSRKLAGAGMEVGSDVVHPNGNIFDQILLQGAVASLAADYALGQITRLSFADLDDDIVQVEFSGPGTLSIVLDGSSGPAAPVNYNQPGVSYMKGHAGIVITGANENTNVSVFTVGRATAVNQALFKDSVTYDGMADLAFVAILSSNGKFGGVRTANASYFASRGLTGLYAPGVQFTGPVYLGDVTAFDAATPVIVLGSADGETRITGGDLLQANGRAVQVSGLTKLKFTDGSDSHGHLLPAQSNRGVLQQDGRDVTAQIVVNPTP